MTEPEDRLREVLRGGESPVGAGSFDDVRRRAARRARRTRVVQAAAVVVVLAVGALAAVPLLRDDEERPQQVVTDPAPTPTTAPAPDAVGDEPLGIWPFVTGADADDKGLELGFNPTDAAEVAEAFLATVVRLDATVEPTGPLGHEVRSVSVDATRGVRRTTVTLRRLGESDRWTVVAAHADGLRIDQPRPGDAVGTGVRVTGRATAFEGTVLVSVVNRDDPPRTLGEAVVTGEQGELRPFAGDVAAELDASGLGAVVAVTESAEDGAVEQAAVVAVRWDAPARDAPLVAVLNRDIPDDPDEQDVVVLAADGSVQRTLLEGFSTVEGGVLDAQVTPDGRSVLVALSTSACTSVIRSIPLDGAAPTDLGPGHRMALSPDGRRIAVAYDVDCNGSDELEVRPLGGEAGAGAPVEGQIAMLTWADDGTLVYDIRGQDGGALIARDVASGDERALDDRWSLPLSRGDGVVHVLVVERDDAYLGTVDAASGRGLGAAARVAPEVVDHTLVGVEPYWLTTDGVLHAFDRVVRTDVAMVAS